MRGALLARQIDSDDVLARLSVPVLVTHGRADEIILPSMADHTLEHGKTAVPEDTERFNHELAAFVDQVRA